MEVINVRCVREFDPPQIQITIANEIPFQVSTAVYQIIKGPLGLPDDPCSLVEG